MAAARYGHAEVLRELIGKYGCDKHAVNEVGHAIFCVAWSSACELTHR